MQKVVEYKGWTITAIKVGRSYDGKAVNSALRHSPLVAMALESEQAVIEALVESIDGWELGERRPKKGDWIQVRYVNTPTDDMDTSDIAGKRGYVLGWEYGCLLVQLDGESGVTHLSPAVVKLVPG